MKRQTPYEKGCHQIETPAGEATASGDPSLLFWEQTEEGLQIDPKFRKRLFHILEVPCSSRRKKHCFRVSVRQSLTCPKQAHRVPTMFPPCSHPAPTGLLPCSHHALGGDSGWFGGVNWLVLWAFPCLLLPPRIRTVPDPGLSDLSVSVGGRYSQGTGPGDPDSTSCLASLHSQTPAASGTDSRPAGNLS